MTPDAHTPCPACDIRIRQLYAAARAVVDADSNALIPAGVLGLLAATVQHCAHLIDAHNSNMDHAFSPNLVAARGPIPPLIAEVPTKPLNGSGELHQCHACGFVTSNLHVLADHVTKQHWPVEP